MTWTTEKPTKPGWYWCRWVMEDDRGDAVACKLDFNDDHVLCLVQEEFDWLPLDEFGEREWSSEPITEPEETL